jgi:hypothetical protein
MTLAAGYTGTSPPGTSEPVVGASGGSDAQARRPFRREPAGTSIQALRRDQPPRLSGLERRAGARSMSAACSGSVSPSPESRTPRHEDRDGSQAAARETTPAWISQSTSQARASPAPTPIASAKCRSISPARTSPPTRARVAIPSNRRASPSNASEQRTSAASAVVG